MFVAAALALSAAQAEAALVSVDFGTTATGSAPAPSPTFSGPEAAATAANARFGAANVWNAIQLPEFNAAAVVNPSFSNLRDNTGAATGIGLSLTGSAKGFSGFNNPSTDTLRKDYLLFNSISNTASTLSFEITGLVGGAA